MIITIVRKPFKGSIIDNVKENQCGGININQSRVSLPEDDPEVNIRKGREHICKKGESLVFGDWKKGFVGSYFNKNGRWPANLILNGGSPVHYINKQSLAGGMHSAGHKKEHDRLRGKSVVTTFGGSKTNNTNGGRYGDTGGASRFFKQVKL